MARVHRPRPSEANEVLGVEALDDARDVDRILRQLLELRVVV
jgi:hypothetical protein